MFAVLILFGLGFRVGRCRALAASGTLCFSGSVINKYIHDMLHHAPLPVCIYLYICIWIFAQPSSMFLLFALDLHLDILQIPAD